MAQQMTTWSVSVELAGVIDVDQAEQILATLPGWTIGINDDRGITTLRRRVDSRSLRAAVERAIRDAEELTGLAAVAVEACTYEELYERLGVVRIPTLVGYADIARMAGVSRQRAAQLAQLPGFPPAIPDAPVPLFPEDPVREWLDNRNTQPGRPGRDETD